MTPADLVVRGRRVVTPEGVREAAVVVRGGHIAALTAFADVPEARETIDAGELVVMPGLVDTHVHVNEPGRAEWEGFATATRAAAAGGVTTIVDMPLNSIPATTTVAALAIKRDAAESQCYVDVGFWGGVVPGNTADLEPLSRAGVLGFKCFMAPSGVDEFAHVSEADLAAAMPLIGRLGLPLLVHAELPGPIEAAASMLVGRDPRRYESWLASRPPEAEVEAIRAVIALAERTGCRVHIVHLATHEALTDLRVARARGVPVTVETCPHYLTFAADEIVDGATEFKCAPPIRAHETRERLWDALRAGEIDLIASDHSPCPPGMKGRERGDFFAAWGGVASLELGLAAVWTEARARGVDYEHIALWMCERPAALAGLARKGRLAAGADADLVLWDPDEEWVVRGAELHHRHPITPYEGRRLRGRVRTTFVRGVIAFDAGAQPGRVPRFPGTPTGNLVDRASETH